MTGLPTRLPGLRPRQPWIFLAIGDIQSHQIPGFRRINRWKDGSHLVRYVSSKYSRQIAMQALFQNRLVSMTVARILPLSTIETPPSRGSDPEFRGSHANQQANWVSQLASLL